MSSKTVAAGLVASLVIAASILTPAHAADLSVRGGYGNAIGTWHHLGFWGTPFPFGYRWSLATACRERVWVDTPRGPRWRTVWACTTPHRLARW
jgi:hypothetical protein